MQSFADTYCRCKFIQWISCNLDNMKTCPCSMRSLNTWACELITKQITLEFEERQALKRRREEKLAVKEAAVRAKLAITKETRKNSVEKQINRGVLYACTEACHLPPKDAPLIKIVRNMRCPHPSQPPRLCVIMFMYTRVECKIKKFS